MTHQPVSLLEQLATAVLTLNSHGYIEYANAAAELLFSGSSRRVQGAPLGSLLRYSSLDLDILYQAFKHQQSVSDSEVTWVLHDGKQMTLELVATPCDLESAQPGQLLELRQVDLIRRLNQAQTQQHQLAAAQHLVRGLAHEIKNPLGGIRGAAQLLDPKLNRPELQEYTQLIIQQADRLRSLVDRLLGPNQPGQRKAVNVHELLERSLQVLTLQQPESLVVRKDYDPSLPDILIVEDQIEQVMLNIIHNALQALAEVDNQRLVIKTRVAHQETIYAKRYRQCLVISILDSGPGVEVALKDTLFYPLVSGRSEGTGLGLSIAQSLVHQHAGKIELNSRPGHTEFTVFLPYDEPQLPADGQAGTSQNEDYHGGRA